MKKLPRSTDHGAPRAGRAGAQLQPGNPLRAIVRHEQAVIVPLSP